MNRSLQRHQQGISLVIALVFLVIITLVAISNMREVGLETRVSGNMIEQKQLLNVAESALRDGERRTVAFGPNEPVESCHNLAREALCLLDRPSDYSIDRNLGMQVYSPDANTILDGDTSWYAETARTANLKNNPEAGSSLQGFGVFLYEVTAVGERNNQNNAVRSTVALNAKGRIEKEQ